MSIFKQLMAYRKMVYAYYNRARKLNHKNENPRFCARNNILNQNYASEAKFKQVTR